MAALRFSGGLFFSGKTLLYQMINAVFFTIPIFKSIFDLFTLILRPL